jgi:lon-related putative ATP-dependent protease
MWTLTARSRVDLFGLAAGSLPPDERDDFMPTIRELSPKDLYRTCDLSKLKFETTADLDGAPSFVGQERAEEAVEFGIGIQGEGYNIFALGPPGSGKHSLLRRAFEARAKSREVPSDWCYVHNFRQPHKPLAIQLPAGQGAELAQDMDRLIEELRTALSTAFESEEYQNRRQEIQETFQEDQEKAFEELRTKAEGEGFTLLRTPAGLGFAPVKDGEVVEPEAFQKLDEEERKKLEAAVSGLQEDLQKILRRLPRLQREMQERLRDLQREMASMAAGGLIEDLTHKYESFPRIVDHLAQVKEDVIQSVRDFVADDDDQGESRQMAQAVMSVAGGPSESPQLRRYKVNLLVDHSQSERGPVVDEDNPTYTNLVGRVEHIPQMGALLTDFNLIKPGALHRANGGYLILDARKVLLQPYAWEGLKRALNAGKIHIESPGQAYGLLSTVSLEPEAIPLDVKVGLMGDRELYYMLSALDPEFDELFKVMADFETALEKDRRSVKAYAKLIAGLAREGELRPFDRAAVGRVIEHASRLVEDSDKLTARLRQVSDLLREADYWAGQRKQKVVRLEDVQKAIDAQIHRADRLRERMQEQILRKTIYIDTAGEQVGQINGLSVIELGGYSFGRPSRITARVRLGKGDVVDIEREVELGGPLHSKGVFILEGFLGARYAEETPLSLSASLVFEQSYGGIDGDSASSAELYALMSAIGELPIRQSLAVTGSVNQLGEIQPIGGVNEKIEGFFDICSQRGLSGDQGVIIPASNIKHLMLRSDVVEAVGKGTFHVYPVRTVDQGMSLLTGLPAGRKTKSGYSKGSFNREITQRLNALAERRQEIQGSDTGTSEGG